MNCKDCVHFIQSEEKGMCLNTDSVFFGLDKNADACVCTEYAASTKEADERRKEAKKNDWIPLIIREMTPEEKQVCDFEFSNIIMGEIPREGEEVAVSYGGLLAFDTWHRATGFESLGFMIDAWMRIRPYRKE